MICRKRLIDFCLCYPLRAAAGLGLRSKRYAMIINNGVILKENVEKSPGEYAFCSYSHAHTHTHTHVDNCFTIAQVHRYRSAGYPQDPRPEVNCLEMSHILVRIATDLLNTANAKDVAQRLTQGTFQKTRTERACEGCGSRDAYFEE
jgi:hypothetical protein